MGTRQIFIDDLDGTEDGVETVGFALDGITYEIDLSESNQNRLRDFMEEFVTSGRVIGRDNTRRRVTPRRNGNRKTQAAQEAKETEATAPAELPAFDTKTARKWLRDNKFPVPDRGVLRGEIVAPYLDSDDFRAWRAAQS